MVRTRSRVRISLSAPSSSQTSLVCGDFLFGLKIATVRALLLLLSPKSRLFGVPILALRQAPFLGLPKRFFLFIANLMFIDVFGDCIADTTKVTRFILQYEAYVQWPVYSSYYLKVLIICLLNDYHVK